MTGMTVCFSLPPFCTYVFNLPSYIFCAGDLWWKIPMFGSVTRRMHITEKAWWAFKGPCQNLYRCVLHRISPWLTETWHCRSTAGGIWMELGQQVSYVGLQGCWKYDLVQKGKKRIWEAVRLAGVSESTIIPATQIREVGAGRETLGMFFHYTCLESEVRDQKLRPAAPRSSILSYPFHPKCVTGKEGSRHLVWMGTRTVKKLILNSSLKTALSSVWMALLLAHLILISFQSAAPWNSWHLKCPLSGNKFETSHNVVKDTLNNQDFFIV